mmetsp:Transcript_83214/g.97237  ORF Transcript_83214/g.97237 Transcript_83214/m.97237 type:complete len:191 (-) Transcript_83214:29-601(-)
MGKITPPNYGMVEEGIHRCATPSPIHFPFLEGLGLRTVIVLADRDSCDEAFLVWIQEAHVRALFPIAASFEYGSEGGDGASASGYSGVSSCRGTMTIPEPTVIELLHVLLDPVNYPVLVTCASGRYRTGITVGCLRKLQGWNMTSIVDEYRRFAGSRGRLDHEEFMELFDVDSVNKSLSDGRKPCILYNS